jgi:molecular chaperone DnaK
LIYVTEKSLKELGDKVPATDRGQIETVIEDLKAAINENDIAKIRQHTESLQQASHALTQQMYQQGAANGSADPGAAPGTGQKPDGDEDDVVEGEYRQV